MRHLALLTATTALAAAMSGQPPPPLHHAIATRSVLAQREFDRGLALIYAFNFQAAERAFRAAAAADPKAAMPYWGLALAEGPNYNDPQPSPAEEREASDSLDAARKRAQALPSSSEASEEGAYIAALALRLSCEAHPAFMKIESAYGSAMAALSREYPDDPDAATLYAESLMEQRGWKLWDSGGSPAQGTQQVLSILGGVLQRWPDHIGANHLNVHAAEASGDPGRALASAQRLQALAAAGFAGDGHLLHMAAHIYLRTGRFAEAERTTLAAAAADRDYLAAHPDDTVYASGLAVHNLSFVVYAASMDGDYAAALRAARELQQRAAFSSLDERQAAAYLVEPLAVMVRFARWVDILGLAGDESTNAGWQTYWHYARACALAGKGDWRSAQREEMTARRLLSHATGVRLTMPPLPDAPLREIILGSMNGRIATADGSAAFAAQQWRRAIAAEDAIGYREPPPWYPMRESLGAALLRAGEGAQAEAVFRDSLERSPGDPRALFGLSQALAAEGQTAAAKAARGQFQAAWRGGALRIEDF